MEYKEQPLNWIKNYIKNGIEPNELRFIHSFQNLAEEETGILLLILILKIILW